MIPLVMIFKKGHSDILHKYNALIIKLLGAKVESTGDRDSSADMFIMNHQGIIDIIAMEAIENTDIRWIAKKELFNLPWIGRLLKIPNMISVDRENKAGLIKLIRDAKETIEEQNHRTLAIFPEGTRTEKQELLPFKSGTRMIAEKLEMKIQPIVITNSKRVLNEHKKTSHGGTTVHITYLDTIQVTRGDKAWYKEIQTTMQNVINHDKHEYERDR